jgi:hypothetical protein
MDFHILFRRHACKTSLSAPLEIFQGAHMSANCTRLSTFPMYTIIKTKLYRKQAEVIQNHENEHVRSIGQGEARNRKYKRFNLGGGQAYDRSGD